MFSSRLTSELSPNRIFQLLARKRSAGVEIFDLTESNPTHAGFVYPAEEILTPLADPRSLVYDPTPLGLLETREEIAKLHGVTPDRILLTGSTSEAYSWLFKLLANPGDDVLVPRPSYPLFEFLAALDSVNAQHYPLRYHEGWFIDFEALEQGITARTRAIVVVNPNNPTGSYLKLEEFERLAAICGERGLAIISDEVFADYALCGDNRRVTTLAHSDGLPLTFVLSGLSKVAGLPQMKLGWIVIGGPDALRAEAAGRLELIADTYLPVGTPVQYALKAILGAKAGIQRQIAARLRANLDFLETAVAGSQFGVLRIEGGWYATLRAPRVRTEEEWVLHLIETANLVVQPGYFYDFDSEPFLILSLLTEAEIFREGVRRLLQASA